MAATTAIVLALSTTGCAKKADDLSIGSARAEMDSQQQNLPAPTGPSTTAPAKGSSGGSGGRIGKITPSATATFVKESAKRTKDASTMRTSITFEGGELNGTAMDMAFDYKQKLMSMVTKSAGEEFTMIVRENDLYMKIPGLGGSMGAEGRDWIKMSDPSMSESFAQGQSDTFGAGANAQSFLDGFLGAGAKVEDLGREDVRGVTTNHYRGTVSAAEAATSGDTGLTEAEKAALAKSLGGEADIPVEVWINDDGVVVKMEMTLSGATYGLSAGETTKMTMELFDVGEPIEIKVPAKEKVLDLENLDDILGGGAGGAGELGGLGGLGTIPGLEDLNGDGLPG